MKPMFWLAILAAALVICVVVFLTKDNAQKKSTIETPTETASPNGFHKAWEQFKSDPELQARALAELQAQNKQFQKEEFQFAVNLDVDFAHLYTLKTKEQTLEYIQGKDDAGNVVSELPISKTSSTVWFDFASAGPELPYDGQDVPLAQFVTNVAYAIRDDMIPRRAEFEPFLLDRAEDLVLKRIVWMPSLESWYPIFEIKGVDTN